MALRKPKPGELLGPQDPPFVDNAFQGDYPCLTEYLFTRQWADGSHRMTSTLSIFTDNGALKLVINDRDNNRSAFISKPTWAEALEALESGLAHDSLDWKSKSQVNQAAMKTPF